MSFSYTRTCDYVRDRAGKARGATVVRTEERDGRFPMFHLMLESERFLGEVRIYSADAGRGFARMDVADMPPHGEEQHVRDVVELIDDGANGVAWFFSFFPE